MNEFKRVKYIVVGKVQGVGFRYFVASKADILNIKGYARNMYDGSVEIVAEGSSDALNEFLINIKKGPSRSMVVQVTIIEEDYKNEFKDFYTY